MARPISRSLGGVHKWGSFMMVMSSQKYGRHCDLCKKQRALGGPLIETRVGFDRR